MTELKAYMVHAKTDGSIASVITDDPSDALRRAREMQSAKCVVTITNLSGSVYTIEDLKAHVLSGAHATPASA